MDISNFRSDKYSVYADSRCVRQSRTNPNCSQDTLENDLGMKMSELSRIMKEQLPDNFAGTGVYSVMQIERMANEFNLKLEFYKTENPSKPTAHFLRRFAKNDDGFVDNHGYANIFDKSLQNNGLSKSVMKLFSEIDNHLDVKQEKLYAENQGLYTWGRYGFLPKDSGEWKKITQLVEKRLDYLTDGEKPILVNGHSIDEKAESDLRSIVNSDDPKSLWKLVDYQDKNGNKPGKYLLSPDFETLHPALGMPKELQNQYFKVYYTFDRDNSEQMKRMTSYLNNGSRQNRTMQFQCK